MQRRRAQHVGPGQARRHLVVAQHAEPVHPVRLGVPAPLHLAARPVARHPQDGRPVHQGERIEQDVQALALLVATEEQHDRAALLVVHGCRRLEARHVDAVEQHLEVAAARPQARLAGRLRDRHPDLHAAADQLGQRLEQAAPSGSRRPGGTSRPSGAAP